MYVIKHLPEDFAVSEISALQFEDKGPFTYFRMSKKGHTTHYAIEQLATAWRISSAALSYAGLKDKDAVTSQICTVRGVGKERIESTRVAGIKVEFLGYGKEPIHTGQLEGNEFRIVVRNIDTLPEIKPRFRNLFGEQRFSTNNAEIGRALVRKEFEKAAKLVAEINESARPAMEKYLNGKEWITALRTIPRKILILFVHAYQSELWNKVAMLTDKEEVPIVGFGSTVEDLDTRAILREENITPNDFVVRALPEVSAEGDVRRVWAEAKQLEIGQLEDDDAFPGKKKVTLSFFLQKGSYATEFIRQQFG